MKKLTSLFLFAFLPLFADSIGQLQYQLPREAAEWKKVEEYKDETTQAIVYVPDGQSLDSSPEAFDLFFSKTDIGDLPQDEKGLISIIASEFPQQKIGVKLLQNDPSSILYEWWTGEESERNSFGWLKAIKTKEGIYTVGYQSENIKDLDKARQIWLNHIKQISILKNHS